MSNTDVQNTAGRIFDIQRFSIHDGPGIRTTVFLKGCPLRCLWCHNPESIPREPVMSFLPDKCIGCGYCFKVCPHQAHQMSDEKHILDRNRCRACGLCVKECYARALELVGRDITVGEAMQEVLSDKPFYETSGGGMTLSGGEPLIQIEFAEAMFRAAKQEGLHCCCDSCAYVDYKAFERVKDFVDLFLIDIKDTNPTRHKENTGVDLERILANLRRLHDDGAAIRMRIPLIPGCNDHKDNLDGLCDLARSLPNLEGVEIMPYHKLGISKLDRFGIGDRMDIRPEPPTDEALNKWITTLNQACSKVLNEPMKTKG